jgi:4'-phosphopantetheinyl transferase
LNERPDTGPLKWTASMKVYWLEQSKSDVPEEDDWLSEREILLLNGFRFARRRSDWRLGRWTAKRAISTWLGSAQLHPDLAKIEIRPALSGAPQIFFENTPAAVMISLSHRNDRGLCAVAEPSTALGCDLERVEPHIDAFVADYFTPAEQAFLARQARGERCRLLALLWSAKESALKALQEGLRLDTRSVVVDLSGKSYGSEYWSPLRVYHAGGKAFHGWWRSSNDLVRTVVASPAPMSPVSLGDGDFYGSSSPFLWSGSLPASKRSSPLPVAR